jgi:hypothetical protein
LAATASELESELPSIAGRLSIVLPWGGLLRAVAQPEIDTLSALAGSCQADASVEIVFSFDERRDRTKATGDLPAYQSFGADDVRAYLSEPYFEAGIRVLGVESLAERDLLAYSTTWAKRLAHGRKRRVWRVRGRKREV